MKKKTLKKNKMLHTYIQTDIQSLRRAKRVLEEPSLLKIAEIDPKEVPCQKKIALHNPFKIMKMDLRDNFIETMGLREGEV